LSKRSRHAKRNRERLVINTPLLPLSCAVGGDDPKKIHYEVRFVCSRTEKEYCYTHYHADACCRPVGANIFRENDEMAKMYVFTLPKCPYCQVPLPHDLKEGHMLGCLRNYVKGFKGKKEGAPPRRIFVPEQDLSYKKDASEDEEEEEEVEKERVATFGEEP